MQSNEKPISEVKKEFDIVYDEMSHSLKYGKASEVLEHDTVVDLALNLGRAHTLANFAARTGGLKSHVSLTALVSIWKAKYDAILKEK